MSPATARPCRSRWFGAALVAMSLLLAACGSTRQPPSAAEQVPRLEVVLHRIDTALAEHHFGTALEQLRTLKAQVVNARDAGDLREADAERVLEAVSRLVKLVPDSETTAPATTGTSPTTRSPEPSTSKTSRRPHPASSTPTTTTTLSPSPSATPSSSPSSSPTSSPDASPTGGATRDASPTASPTSGQ